MDLDEDTEVKSPEPQAQPGEREAGSQRLEGPAPAPQPTVSMPRSTSRRRPRDASETPLWGSGPGIWRWEASAGAEGAGEGLAQSEGRRNRSVWRSRSVCGGAAGMHELPCAPGWGGGRDSGSRHLSQRFKPEAPGRGQALSARSGGQLPLRGRQGHRCGHLSFSPSRESVQERLGSGSPGGPGESAQQGGQRGVWGPGEGTCAS